MTRFKIGVIALLLIAQRLSAQPNRFQDVVLTGRITDTLLNHPHANATVTVQVSRYPFSHEALQGAENKIYETDVKFNQTFKFTIVPPAKRCYVYIYYINHWARQNKLVERSWSSVDNIYILDAGDKIDAELEERSFSFKGKGAAKLNCETEIYKNTFSGLRIPEGFGEKLIKLNEQGRYQEAREAFSHKKDSCLTIQTAIVEKYRSLIGSELADIMLANCYGIRYYWELRGYNQIWASDPKMNHDILNSDRYKKIDLNLNRPALVLANSPVYVDALFQKIKLEDRFDKNGNFDSANYYDRIFSTIQTGYSGIIRDKLLAIFFIISSQFTDSSPYIRKALKICGPSIYREVIIHLQKTHTKGTNFYSFALPDTRGKIVTLSSLSNKIVILDFWFTGCENCLVLHRNMKPIHEKFKNNPKVAFVSVSIDKDQHMWLNSVASGKYTDQQDINLYTGGRGINDPLLAKYSIASFPTVFVLKNGGMFNSNPPRPMSNSLTDKASMHFVDLIDAAIFD